MAYIAIDTIARNLVIEGQTDQIRGGGRFKPIASSEGARKIALKINDIITSSVFANTVQNQANLTKPLADYKFDLTVYQDRINIDINGHQLAYHSADFLQTNRNETLTGLSTRVCEQLTRSPSSPTYQMQKEQMIPIIDTAHHYFGVSAPAVKLEHQVRQETDGAHAQNMQEAITGLKESNERAFKVIHDLIARIGSGQELSTANLPRTIHETTHTVVHAPPPKDLTNELKATRAALKEATGKTADLEVALTQAQQDAARARAETAAAEQGLQAFSTRISTAESEKADALTALDQSAAALEQLEQRHEELQTNASATHEEKEDALAQLQQAQSHLTDAEGQVQRFTIEISTVKEERDAAIRDAAGARHETAAVQQELQTLNIRILEAENARADALTAKNESAASLAILEQAHQELQTQACAIEDDLAAISEQKNLATTDLTQAKAQVETLSSELTAALDAQALAEENLAAEGQDFHERSITFQRMSALYMETDRNYLKAQSNCAKAEQEVSGLKKQVQALSAEKDAALATAAASTSNLTALQAEHNSLKGKLAELSQTLSGDLAGFQFQEGGPEASVEDLSAQHERLLQKLRETSEKLKKAEVATQKANVQVELTVQYTSQKENELEQMTTTVKKLMESVQAQAKELKQMEGALATSEADLTKAQAGLEAHKTAAAIEHQQLEKKFSADLDTLGQQAQAAVNALEEKHTQATSSLQKQLGTAQTELEHALMEIESNEELGRMLEDKESKIHALNQTRAHLETQVTELQDRLGQMQGEHNKNQTLLQADHDAAYSLLADKNESHAAEMREILTKLGAAKDRATTAASRVEELEIRTTGLIGELEAIQAQQSTQAKTISALREELEEKQATIETLEEELQESRSQKVLNALNDLEASESLGNLETPDTSHVFGLSVESGELAILQLVTKTQAANIEALEKQIAALEEQFEEQEASYYIVPEEKAMAQELEEKLQELNQLKADHSALETKAAYYQQLATNAQMRADSTQMTLEETQETIDKLKADKAQLQTAIKKFRAELKEAEIETAQKINAAEDRTYALGEELKTAAHRHTEQIERLEEENAKLAESYATGEETLLEHNRRDSLNQSLTAKVEALESELQGVTLRLEEAEIAVGAHGSEAIAKRLADEGERGYSEALGKQRELEAELEQKSHELAKLQGILTALMHQIQEKDRKASIDKAADLGQMLIPQLM